MSCTLYVPLHWSATLSQYCILRNLNEWLFLNLGNKEYGLAPLMLQLHHETQIKKNIKKIIIIIRLTEKNYAFKKRVTLLTNSLPYLLNNPLKITFLAKTSTSKATKSNTKASKNNNVFANSPINVYRSMKSNRIEEEALSKTDENIKVYYSKMIQISTKTKGGF